MSVLVNAISRHVCNTPKCGECRVDNQKCKELVNIRNMFTHYMQWVKLYQMIRSTNQHRPPADEDILVSDPCLCSFDSVALQVFLAVGM